MIGKLKTSQLKPSPPLMPYRIVEWVGIAIGLLLAASYAYLFWQSGVSPGLAGKDFVNYWMGAQLAAQGHSADVFGPQPIYFKHLTDTFGTHLSHYNWSYPPHYLLLMMPLALCGYKLGIAVFLLLTGAIFIYATRTYAQGKPQLAQISIMSAVLANLWLAQNGFLTSGLILLCLHHRQARPLLAGALLGVLSVKPQLAFILPLLLLAERNWRALAMAALVTGLLVGASILAFGQSSWHDYVTVVLPYQTNVMMTLRSNFLTVLPSLYGAVRLYGGSAHMAMMVHLIAALPVIALTIWGFLRISDMQMRAALAAIATLLITPYALFYDLGFLGVTLSAVIGAQPFWRLREHILFACAMTLPLLMFVLGHLGFAVAPLVLYPLFGLILVRGSVDFQHILRRKPLDTEIGNRQSA